MPRLILLSFTSTLNALASGVIRERDLLDALYFFGCCRSWAFEDDEDFVLDAQRRAHPQHPSVCVETIRIVKKGLRNADQWNMAAWRRNETTYEYVEPETGHRALNELLERHQLSPIDPATPPSIKNNRILAEAILDANGDRVLVIR